MNQRLYKFRPFEFVKESYCNSFRPGPRSGHRVCCDDSNLYSYGGYNFKENDETHNLYKEIICYNFISKRWTLLNDDETTADEDCPDELASSAMMMYGKTLVIFGGTSYPFGLKCSDRVHLAKVDEPFKITELVTTNDEWNQPPGQYGMSIVGRNNFMYTVGGTQGYDYTADIYRLDFQNHKWELLATSRPQIDPIEPIGRYRHEIAIDERFIYIFGGGTADRVFDLKSLPCYDLQTRKWRTISTFRDVENGYPSARKCHSLVQLTIKDIYDNEEIQVFITGGTNENGPLNDVWRLSLKTRRWMRFRQTSLGTTLYFHDSSITRDGCMYVFGGITTNRSRTNNLYKMWVTIPKLSSIAWEALIHYYPMIHHAPKSFMLEKGVPLRYVNRIHN